MPRTLGYLWQDVGHRLETVSEQQQATVGTLRVAVCCAVLVYTTQAAPASRISDVAAPSCNISQELLRQWDGMQLHAYANGDQRQSQCHIGATIPLKVFCQVDCKAGFTKKDNEVKGLSCKQVSGPFGPENTMDVSDLPNCTGASLAEDFLRAELMSHALTHGDACVNCRSLPAWNFQDRPRARNLPAMLR